MSATPFSVTSSDTYTMFDILVTDAAGNSKEYGSQVGGGRLSSEQLANEIQVKNLFPGAQKVVIRPAVSPVPQMSIQKRIEAAQKSGLKQKMYTTPKPEIAKTSKPADVTVIESPLSPEEMTSSGDPAPEPVHPPVKSAKSK